MNPFSKLIRNTLSLYMARFFEVIIQLVILAFIISRMGRETYGAALLIISIQETMDLIRSGIGKATIKYLSEYNAKHDYLMSKCIFSTSTAIHVCLGILGLCLCIIITPFSESIFGVPGNMITETRIGTIIMGFGILITFAFTPWRNALMSHERYDLSSKARVLGRFISALTIVGFYYLSHEMLIGIILGTLAGNLSEVMLCMLMVKKVDHYISMDVRSSSRSSLNKIMAYAGFDILHSFSTILYKNGSFYLCAHLISLTAVAGLGIIFNICRLLGYLINEVAQTIVPITSRLASLGEYDKIKKVIISGTSVAVCLGGLVLVGMVPLMDSFLSLWLGNSYIYLSSAAVILLIAESLRSSVSYIHCALSGTGHVTFDGLSDLCGTIIGILIGVLLVSFFDLGFGGYVIGLSCANIFRFISITVYGAKVFQINIIRLLWLGHFRVYTLMASFIIIALLLRVQAHSWITLLVAGGVPAGCFLIICFYIVLDTQDRLKIVGIIQHRLGILREKV